MKGGQHAIAFHPTIHPTSVDVLSPSNHYPPMLRYARVNLLLKINRTRLRSYIFSDFHIYDIAL